MINSQHFGPPLPYFYLETVSHSRTAAPKTLAVEWTCWFVFIITITIIIIIIIIIIIVVVVIIIIIIIIIIICIQKYYIEIL